MNIPTNVDTSKTHVLQCIKYILEILLIEIYEIYLELELKFEDRVIWVTSETCIPSKFDDVDDKLIQL